MTDVDDKAAAAAELVGALRSAHRLTPKSAKRLDGVEPFTHDYIQAFGIVDGRDLGSIDMADVERPFSYKFLVRPADLKDEVVRSEHAEMVKKIADTYVAFGVDAPAQCRVEALERAANLEGLRGCIVRTVEPHEVRGWCRRVGKHMVSISDCVVDGKGVRFCPPTVFDAPSMNNLDPLARHAQDPDVFSTVFALTTALRRVFIKRYQWSVLLAYEDAPAISFQTDPIGAREVFRLRDLPDGATRRAALLHWVKEHWRKKRSDPAEEAKVRAHLRGQEAFVWSGLRCRIKPSPFDREQADKAKA